MAENVKSVLEYLRAEGVEISTEAAVAAEKTYGGQVLATSDKVLSDGQIAVDREFNAAKSNDLSAWKEKARKLETQLREAEDALTRGDKVSTAKLDAAVKENEGLKAIATRYMAEQRKVWSEVEKLKTDGKMPDNIAAFYTFPGEGEQIDDDAMLHNVEKYREHQALGVFGDKPPAVPPGGPPRGAPAGPLPPNADGVWRDKSAHAKMEHGLVNPNKTRSASMADEGD